MNQLDLNQEKLNNDLDINDSSDISNEELKVEFENDDFSRNQDKKIVKNIFFVALSNIITLLAGVLVGFVVPKMMSIEDHGYYRIFTLYFGYVGLFHLGFVDGIYLYFAGEKYDKLNREKFRLFSRFLFVFQSIVLLIVVGISMFFMGSEYMPILLFIGISLLANNLTTYYQMISQITYRFKELSIINSLKSILTIVSVLVLFLIYKFTDVGLINYQIYVIIFLGIQYLLTIFYVIAYRDITFGKSEKFKENRDEILGFFKLGFPLLLANFVSVLLLNIDRQFVSIWFTTEEYSMYAFAYNLLSLVTTTIGAIATVLYPSLKTKKKNELKKSYHSINAVIMSIVTIGLMGYFPLSFIVEWILPKYVDSLTFYKIVSPGLLYSSSVTIILANYYKSINKVRTFFIISLGALVLSIIADIVVYYTIGTMESISYASVGVLFIYYIVAEIIMTKKLNIINFKNLIYSILIVTFFYLSVYLISNIYIQMTVFVLSGLIILLIFNYKPIIKLLKNQLL